MTDDAMVVDADPAPAAPAYDVDVIVIGGGSGGIAFGKTAADLGAKVALFDFVKPTQHGTRWGIGGTCVNVGCIPKKLMHYTGLLHDSFHDAQALGWEIGQKPELNWTKMLETVNNYVLSMNFGYRTQLRQKGVDYIKAYASFVDPHTVKYQKSNSEEEETVSGKYIVLAMGGRPYVPKIPGRELVITSDDIFWRERAPGKTLCVGASYISLETAGFLHSMGFDVTVAVRSILLRGFDRQCADAIGQYMKDTGMKFRMHQTPQKLEKLDDGKIRVTFQMNSAYADEDSNSNSNEEKSAEQSMVEIFDTVLYATGRAPETKTLNLAASGVEIEEQNGKIRCSKEQTNVKHIYAVGDIVYGALELTPVAIQAGHLLADRLFAQADNWMDYTRVATTVFTPVEYGCCGYSEEAAGDVFGAENLEIYIMKQTPLETKATHRVNVNGDDLVGTQFMKLICDKTRNERVVGIHYVGPNAGEVIQGYALAVKIGCTKADFDDCVGIHPTCAEWFTVLTVTKASGKSAEATGC